MILENTAFFRFHGEREPLTRKYYAEFYQCEHCDRIYWKGSHYLNLIQKLERLRNHV